MKLTKRFFRPLDYCAAGVAGLALWASTNAVLAQPSPVRQVAYSPVGAPALPPPPPPPSLLQPALTSSAHIVVDDVLIQGSQLISVAEIKSYLKTRPGCDYNPDQVQNDARTLVNGGKFADVRVEVQNLKDGRVIVIYQLRDRPTTIQKIEYRGAKHLKDDELATITGLYLDAPLSPTKNKLACQRIVHKYNEQGRPMADCILLSGDKELDTEVIFQITEGQKITISDIQFTGNNFVSGAVLATHINSAKKLLGLFGGDLNRDMLDDDIRKLREYYLLFGYYDIQASFELQYLPDGHNAVVVFHLNEGERYRLKGKPTVVGEGKAIAHESLEQLSKAEPDQYVNNKEIARCQKEIVDWYGYQGIEARVEAIPYFPKDVPGYVEVHYEIEEHKPAKVGQIFIIGNERTKMNVILRQVGLYPGQTLSYPEIRLAQANLARLGIFKSTPDGVHPTIDVVNDPHNPDSEYKDVIIHVEEDNTGSLLFGVGVNSDAGLTGSVVVNERNFDILRPPTSFEDIWEGRAWRGAGQEFRAEAVPGTQLQRYTVSWRDPFIFDSQFSLGVSGYYFERQYNEYTEERLGGRVTVGRKLGNLFDWQEAQYWTASVGLRVENVGVSQVPVGAPVDFTSVQGNNFLVALRAGANRDTRDSFLRPTEGSQLDLSYEQVSGDHNYPLVNIDFNKFWTMWERADGSGRHVLALHSQFGWAGDNTPVYDRFYAGGFRSLRGFQFRGVGPDVNGFKTGGDFMLLNSLEYQIPIKANDSIYFVGFVDSGTVESRIDKLTDYRVSAGVGVRFVVPILGPVPIALDLGFPIVKGPNDNTQVFSFWLGFYR